MVFSDTESEDEKAFKFNYQYIDCREDKNSIEDDKHVMGGSSGHSSCKNMTNKYNFKSFLGQNG